MNAPGSEHEATTMTIKSTNSVGISIFAAFSMPLRTPRVTTKWVIRTKAMAQRTGFSGSEEKVAKYSFTNVASPLMLPASDAKRYCRHHPATTA